MNSMAVTRKNAGNSGAEDRFIELFCDTFGAEKGQYTKVFRILKPGGVFARLANHPFRAKDN